MVNHKIIVKILQPHQRDSKVDTTVTSQSHNTQQEGGDELKQLWFIVHIRIDSQAPHKVFRTTIQKKLVCI